MIAIVAALRGVVLAGGLLAAACSWAQAPSAVEPVMALTLADALQQALSQNPNLLLSREQVQSARGNVMQAQGNFDAVGTLSTDGTRNRDPLSAAEQAELARLGADGLGSHDSSQLTTQLSVQKLLTNGLTVGSEYTVQRNTDALQALQGGVGSLPQSTGRLSFSLKIPLLRNAGRDVIGAAAEAAASELAATQASLEFSSSQAALSAALFYWDLAARQSQLDLAREGEERTRRLLGEMRKLADADELPQAELELMLAILADKTATRIAAEQAVNTARSTLARHLGLHTSQGGRALQAATPFPQAEAQAVHTARALADRLPDTLARRADLRAAERREEAARLQRAAAQNNLKPLAQLNVGVSQGGLAYGASSSQLLSPYTSRLTGPSVSVGLQLQWPVDNQQARGQLLTRAAEAVSAEITRRDLQAGIENSVQLASSALEASVRQLELATVAVGHFTRSLANERLKRRMGAGTLIDVLNVEDRLNAAQQSEIQARLGYASAVAQLLFETGRLVRKRSTSEFEVTVDALLNFKAETADRADKANGAPN